MARSKMNAEHINNLLVALTCSSIFRYVPLRTVQQQLKELNLCSKRKRLLPAESIIYLLITMALHADVSILSNLRKMLAPIRLSLGAKDSLLPAKSAIVKARKRLGSLVFENIFKVICRPYGSLKLKGCYWKGYRMVAIDGTSQSVQNTPANRKYFGSSHNQNGEAYNPKLRILGLLECGTKMFFALKHAPYEIQERELYRKMIRELKKDMVVFADRNFYGFEVWQESLKRAGALIWRVSKCVKFPEEKRLKDGSYLSIVKPCRKAVKGKPSLQDESIRVRIVEFYPLFEDGTKGELVRLVTNILNPQEASAEEISAVYPERWLIENGFGELKECINTKEKILRSQIPTLVIQELYGFFIAHYVVRLLMCKSAEENNLSPNELSFHESMHIIKERMIFFPSGERP